MCMEGIILQEHFKKFLSQAEKMEAEYSGIEAENFEKSEETEEPYEIQNIRIDQKMITVFQTEHWILDGKLNLFPEYQRNLVWDDGRKSALMESLMLRIPIPSFSVEEDSEGKLNMIDGLQRLSAIHSFLNNEFPLQGMQYLSSCEQKYFKDLELKLRTRIEDTLLAVNILDERCPQMVKFDIFRRMNTSGLPLNSQEIRNVMALPKVRLLLRNMAGCEEFSMAVQGKVNDIRMGAQELCLQFLSVRHFYDWGAGQFRQYPGLMKMMDQTILDLNEMQEQVLEDLFQDFRIIMENCYKILKERSFCKPGSNRINRLLFTSWAVVLSNTCTNKDIDNALAEKLWMLYEERLTNDRDFYDTVTSSARNKNNHLKSIAAIRRLWEESYDKFNRIKEF